MNPKNLFQQAGGFWQWLKHNGDALLAVTMVAMVLGSLTLLLVPKPIETVVFKPGTVVNDGFSELAPAFDSEREALLTQQAKRQYRVKKPVKPPILNVNTATVSQLDLLPGIGPALAKRIVAYRKAHGRFQSIEQLQEVSGIGPKKLIKMRPYLRL